jgi:hypothetical protein
MSRDSRFRQAGALSAVVPILLAGSAACDLVTPRDPPDLGVSITAAPASVVLGGEITFEVSATGPHLTFFIIRFGDGNSDIVDPLGAQFFSRTVSHLYEEEGVYAVVVEVADSTGGQLSDSVEVEVLPEQDP